MFGDPAVHALGNGFVLHPDVYGTLPSTSFQVLDSQAMPLHSARLTGRRIHGGVCSRIRSTYYIKADLGTLGAGVIGSTSNVLLQGSYNLIAGAMVSDASDELGNAIVGALPHGCPIQRIRAVGRNPGLKHRLSKANVKALGFGGLDAAFGASDATHHIQLGFWIRLRQARTELRHRLRERGFA